MKTLKTLSAFIAMSAISVSYSFGQTKNLEVVVTNIGEVKGYIVVYLYDKKENYPKEGRALREIKLPVTADKMSVIIENIPIQEYALVVHHDENSDGKCNTNALGMPLEKIAFSNNVKLKLRTPPFGTVKIGADATKITMELFYYLKN